jgi:hypothetical protein
MGRILNLGRSLLCPRDERVGASRRRRCHLITLIPRPSPPPSSFNIHSDLSSPLFLVQSFGRRSIFVPNVCSKSLLPSSLRSFVQRLHLISIRRRDVRSRAIYTIFHPSCSSARPLITLHHPNPSRFHPDPYHSSTDHRSGISDIEDIPPESGKAARGRGRG